MASKWFRSPWTFGAPEPLRLRERERFFVAIRWVVVGVSVIGGIFDPGRYPALFWSLPVVMAATNVAAVVGMDRLRDVDRLRRLAISLNVADVAVAAAAMFNYAHYIDTATGLLLVLVVLATALRWSLLGGMVGGAAGGALSVMWMLHREAEFGIDFRVSTAFARFAAYLLAGLLLGALMRSLDEVGGEVRRSVQRTDAIGRFALEAPRLGIEEAASRLAHVLHDDLGFLRTAVLLVDDDHPGVFRLVATAGYEGFDVDRYRHFPVTVGVVGRCFRTGEPQLLRDIASDPDYIEVDPYTRSEMAVPLRSGDAVFGVIDVADVAADQFEEADLRFLETVAAQLGRAVDNARLAEMERRTIDELARLSAMKDDFIAIANHELRTPVTSIAGFAQSLLKQRDVLSDEERDDALERIARQSAHLKRLLDDLLTLPRDEGSRIHGELRPVDVAAVTEEVVRALDPRTGLHHFDLAFPDDLPKVEADPAALRRICTNLVGNAVKYSPDGGTVRIAAHEVGDQVRVEVVDEGIGIHPADVPVLFTKFGRLALGDDGRGGMGLGLFIVKELVEEMGGAVGVDSQPGAGSVFWFALAVAEETVGA